MQIAESRVNGDTGSRSPAQPGPGEDGGAQRAPLMRIAASQAPRHGVQERKAVGRTSCIPDDRGRLAPFPDGKGGGMGDGKRSAQLLQVQKRRRERRPRPPWIVTRMGRNP